MNEYFAGAFFVLTPDEWVYQDMLRALAEACGEGGNYVYGEQDFLNDYWRGPSMRVVLDSPYHCLAEDIATSGRDPLWTSISTSRAKAHARAAALEGLSEIDFEAAAAFAEAAGAATAARLSNESTGHRPNTSASTTAEAICKLVEYASCDPYGETGVRWKPWMDTSLLQPTRSELHGEIKEKKVCRYPPTDAFWRVHDSWLRIWDTAAK